MKRTLIIICSIVLAIALGVFVYLKTRKLDDFEPQIKAKLQEVVRNGSRGLYRMDAEKVTVDVVESKIILSNVHIGYDSLRYATLIAQKQAPKDVFELKFKSLVIDGLSAADVLARKNLDLNVIYLDNPEISVYHHDDAFKPEKPGKEGIYDLIHKEIGSLTIKQLLLRNAKFKYFDSGRKMKTQFADLTLSLQDIDISEDTQFDTSRFLFASDAWIKLKGFKTKTADSIYSFSLDSITINAARKTAQIARLRLQPRASKLAFRKLVKFRKDRYDIDVRALQFHDIAWWQFISTGNLYVGSADIANGNIEIYSDKAIPGDGKKKLGNYPHQQLFKVGKELNIRKISLKRMLITYSEFNTKTGKEGHIIFANTDATVKNVTNMADVIAANGTLAIDATTKFMHAGTLNAGFRFDLRNQEKGLFSVYARLNNMEGRALNPATEALASVRVEEARIKTFRTDISGDNYRAKGVSYLRYEDLKISALKEDDGKLKKRGLVSFIANNFKINKSYPDKEQQELPAVRSQYARPADRSFFALIWKTIFEGLKEPVGF